jgi:hypothetical protein
MPPCLRRLAPFGQGAASRPPDTTHIPTKEGITLGSWSMAASGAGDAAVRPSARQRPFSKEQLATHATFG